MGSFTSSRDVANNDTRSITCDESLKSVCDVVVEWVVSDVLSLMARGSINRGVPPYINNKNENLQATIMTRIFMCLVIGSSIDDLDRPHLYFYKSSW